MAEMSMKLDYYMMDYHKYKLNGKDNPNRNDESRILYFAKKKMKIFESLKVKEHQFYTNIRKWIKGILQQEEMKDKTIVLTIAPGHLKSSTCRSPQSFTYDVADMIIRNYPQLIDGRSQLVRTKDVEESKTQKVRRKKTHLDSIEVHGDGDISELNRGKVVFILDDIWTTGCTLSACKDKIMETGAANVILLAIGKTVFYDLQTYDT